MLAFDVTVILSGHHFEKGEGKAEWVPYDVEQHEIVYAEGMVTESEIERFIWDTYGRLTNWNSSTAPSVVKVTVTPRIGVEHEQA